MAIAVVSGFLALRSFVRLHENRRFHWFAGYCGLAGLAFLAYLATTA